MCVRERERERERERNREREREREIKRFCNEGQMVRVKGLYTLPY